MRRPLRSLLKSANASLCVAVHTTQRLCSSSSSHQRPPPSDDAPPRRGGGGGGRGDRSHSKKSRRPSSSARRGRGGSFRARQQTPGEEPAELPRSLDRHRVAEHMDVEKHFPAAISHLKRTPRYEHVAAEHDRRQWHDATHEFNVDGIRPTHKLTEEQRAGVVPSFFEEGSLDIRGSLADRAKRAQDDRSSSSAPLPSRQSRLSPDVLKLTGGDPTLHGMSLAEKSNQAPADPTIELTNTEEGVKSEYGDTPVQLTDMLRERLMELKGETLQQERNDTFMPRRLSLSTTASRKGGGERLLPMEAKQQELLALAQRAEEHNVRKSKHTLADWADPLEDATTATEGATTASGDIALPAVLRDGASATGRQRAQEVLHSADSYVPGSAADSDSHLYDPLRRDATRSPPEVDGSVYLLRTLPRAGFCSRREAVTIIASGQVRVNNVVERNPFRLVRAEDDIHVSGHQSRLRFAPPRLWMYHKPANVIVSRNDVMGRALITRHARILGMDHLIPVGSLPMRAHGILMLTNDGELSQFLENPASQIQRTYLLRVRPAIDPILAHRFNTEGININGKQYKGVEFMVNPSAKSRFSLKVKMRGDTMPVAHLLQHIGRRVERGGRISFGPFALGTLAVGSVREVTVPPAYSDHLGLAWKTFVERDWPFFRRQRMSRLRRLARYRELTPAELEELDNFTYEEVQGALSFESQELSAAADERAAFLSRRPEVGETPLPADYANGEVDMGGWSYDDSIVEDITTTDRLA